MQALCMLWPFLPFHRLSNAFWQSEFCVLVPQATTYQIHGYIQLTHKNPADKHSD